MKTGLILEGGAMRGLFTAGVLDVMAESGLTFDGAIGVSAGAVFGCNLKSRQQGRVLRYNLKYCRDWRYSGFRAWLTTGAVYGVKMCYRDLPERLDPFDYEAYEANPMPFWCVATDVKTGQPLYHRCDTLRGEDMLWLRASASMPLVSRPVRVGSRKLLDGGISDSIPVTAFEAMGFGRNVVVLTRPEGYVKEPNRLAPLMRMIRPALGQAMARRHESYNETLALIRAREAEGRLLVIRPPRPVDVKAVEHDPQKLQAAYDMGRETALARLEELRAFTDRKER